MAPTFTYESSTGVNAVVWISSLPLAELGPSRRMSEEVKHSCDRADVAFERVDVSVRDELIACLADLEQRSRLYNARPFLVFDCHAGTSEGLVLERDGHNVSWQELGALLRRINLATGNNLCVLGAACHSLHAIEPTQLSEAAPFFLLLAPEEEVSVGFLEREVPRFFKSLFDGGNIRGAFRDSLAEKFTYFHCEKMLFVAVERYVRTACFGRAAKERRERLFVEVIQNGGAYTKEDRRRIRMQIKEGIKPDQAMLDRYAQTFLIGRVCSFTMVDVINFIESKPDDA